MIKVAAFWELGWNTPFMEVDSWQYPLRDFGIDEFYMIPISGIKSKYVIEKESLQQVLDENKDLQIVFVSESGKVNLKDFNHPENVLYIFGRTNYSPFNNMKREQDLSVRIETKLNKGMLWGHQAVSIILYDRLIKNVSNNNR